jgi:hypothetical protein
LSQAPRRARPTQAKTAADLISFLTLRRRAELVIGETPISWELPGRALT